MSEPLIDNWLDDEMDEKSMEQLEKLLREDPEQLQVFFDTVKLQEELRLYYGETLATITLPSRQRRGIRLIVSLSAVAALVVVGLLIFPRASEPQPTADPLVWVLAGNPQVEISKVDPGPNPFFIPYEEWAVGTRVTILDELSTLRWGENCEFEAGPGTILFLRSAPDHDVPKEPRSIRLNSGNLTVRLAGPAVPVDILVGDSRVRAAQPVVFTIRMSEPDPVLSVTAGNVDLLLLNANRRGVAAGERISLP